MRRRHVVSFILLARLLIVCCLTPSEGPFRDLLQTHTTITSEQELRESFASLESGQTFRLDTRRIVLTNAIEVNVPDITIEGVRNQKTIIECSQKSDSGSALIIRADGIQIRRVEFRNCFNQSAVIIDVGRHRNSKAADIEFEDVHFSQNGQLASKQNGAAFRENTAIRGGAIYVRDTHLEILDSFFEGNVAEQMGGAIFFTNLDQSALRLIRTRFQNNRATGDVKGNLRELTVDYSAMGGGVFALSPYELIVQESTFASNAGCKGGGALGVVRAVVPSSGLLSFAFNISNSVFDNNFGFCGPQPNALQHSFAERYAYLGGAIMYEALVDGGAEWNITNSLFTGNKARAGGAVSVQAEPLSTAVHTISNSTFDSNVGLIAGGTLTAFSSHLIVMSTDIRNSRANNGGGILTWRFGTLTILEDPRNPTSMTYIRNCEGIYGGAIYADDSGPLDLTAVVLRNNTAYRYGAAFRIFSVASAITLRGVTVENNRALVGGGIAIYALPNITIAADHRGRHSLFRNNVASIGGAFYYEPGHDVLFYVVIENTDFEGNKALRSDRKIIQSIINGERFFEPFPDAGVVVPNVDEQLNNFTLLNFLSSIPEGHGGAVCMTLLNARLFTVAEVTFENVTLTKNIAVVGGGMSLHMSDLYWNEGNNSNGCFPAAFGLDTCQRMLFVNVTARTNKAEYAGGVYSTLPQGVNISCERTNSEQIRSDQLEINHNGTEAAERYCTRMLGNSFTDDVDAQGKDAGTRVVYLKVKDYNGTELPQVASGDPLSVRSCPEVSANCTPYLQIEVLDTFAQRIFRGVEDANLELTLISDSITGALRYTAEGGIAMINSTQAWGVNRTSTLEIISERYPTVRLNLTFSTRSCNAGESDHDDICTPCPKDQYGFNSSLICQVCEANANCSGGPVHVPNNGYWHSTPFSPVFHECLHPKACNFDGRNAQLIGFYNDTESVREALRVLNADIEAGNVSDRQFAQQYAQCKEGYEGILCGSCQEDYGHSVDGDCEKCPEKTSRGFYIFLSIAWLFVLIGINCAITLLSINTRIEHVKHELRGTTTHARHALRRAQQIQRDQKTRRLEAIGSATLTPNSSNAVDQQEQRLLAQQLATTVQLTEMLKILMNYLQITSAALRLQTDWSTLLNGLLSVQAGLIGFSSEVLAVPYECNFRDDHGEPSINALWMRLGTPWIVLTALLLTFSLTWTISLIFKYLRPTPNTSTVNFSRVRFMTCAIVIIIVTTYFSYIAVVQEFLRAVNCIEIEEPEKRVDSTHPYIIYATEPGGERRWAEDTDFVCYEGKHLPVGIIGVLGLLWSFCGILSIIFWLPLNKKHVGEAEFVARYWFLFQAYRSHWYTAAWEATVLTRKALIAAVVVFSNHLSPTLQAAMCAGILIVCFLLHVAFSPFKIPVDQEFVPEYSGEFLRILHMPKLISTWLRFHNSINLNSLESASISSSIIIFYSAIILHDSNSSPLGRTTMVTFAFVVNIVFLIYILFRLYAGIHVLVDLKLEYSNAAFMASHENSMGVFNLVVKGIEMAKQRKPETPPYTSSHEEPEPLETIAVYDAQESNEIEVAV